MAAGHTWTVRCNALRLARWNADRVRGRKPELLHFLSQHSVDICLLNETFLNPGQAFRLANSLPPHTQTDSRRRCSHPGPPWYSPTLSTHSGADPLGSHCCSSHIGRETGENPCGLHLIFPPIDRSGPDRLFWRGIAGDLNAKHGDWNSLLTSRRGKLLRDYANENSRLIFGPDTATTNPYNPPLLPMYWTSR
jgi:hypothetical protein